MATDSLLEATTAQNEDLYIYVIVIPFGVVFALVVLVVLVVLVIMFCTRKRGGKHVGITNIESSYVDSRNQSSASTEHLFVTM